MSVSVRSSRALSTAAACALALAVAGCGSAATERAAQEAEAPAPAAAAADQAAALTVTDPWVRAGQAELTPMFATFTTEGSTPVTVMSATTTASECAELHEVVANTDGSPAMRVKEDGFVVEPGTPHVLAPGGDHIMILNLPAPIPPGDSVDVTLTLDDGSTTTFSALAKETSAGDENYQTGGEAGAADDMAGMGGDMSAMSGCMGATGGEAG